LEAKITRYYTDANLTLGKLHINGIELHTLERGWLNNTPMVSCIPQGSYNVLMTYSNKFKRMLYEVRGVRGRAGIRIHPANYSTQLNGCIALGMEVTEQNTITQSRKAHATLEAITKGQPFRLIIEDKF
jgi:hypothetical protein